jgi:hypothetical protein
MKMIICGNKNGKFSGCFYYGDGTSSSQMGMSYGELVVFISNFKSNDSTRNAPVFHY